MDILEKLTQLADRLLGYLRTEPHIVLAEFIVIWAVVYMVVRFLRGTRGARVIKGAIVILILLTLGIQIFGQGDTFERLNFLYRNFIAFISLMLIIVFQPELRRALVRLGEFRVMGQSKLKKARVTEEVLSAVEYLSRNKIGALLAIEQQVGLRGIVEAGTALHAEVSDDLLKTIFWPGSALHDLGVVMRGDRVLAAGVQFPLAEGDQLPQELGSRHRAAIGLSQDSDAVVVVVSEETGTISVAERGTLTRGLSTDDLRPIVNKALGTISVRTDEENDETDTTAAQDDPPASVTELKK